MGRRSVRVADEEVQLVGSELRVHEWQCRHLYQALKLRERCDGPRQPEHRQQKVDVRPQLGGRVEQRVRGVQQRRQARSLAGGCHVQQRASVDVAPQDAGQAFVGRRCRDADDGGENAIVQG